MSMLARVALTAALCLPLSAQPAPLASRPEAQTFLQRMVATHGFDAAELQRAFEPLTPLDRIKELAMPTQAPAPKHWAAYKANVLDPKRIREGRAFLKRHARQLARLEAREGIPREILVAILGVETRYGQRMGHFPTLQTLATLAFDHPEGPTQTTRKALFLEQLEAFLLLCRKERIDPLTPTGSFAGAIGIPQFLPTSILNFGRDGDGDGQVRLTESPADALASAAAFLRGHGWEPRRPIVWRLDDSPETLRAARPLADGAPTPGHRLGDLATAGLIPRIGAKALARERETQVILIDLPTPDRDPEYALGFQNFYAITRYNRSFFYAMSVWELAEALRSPRPASRKAKAKSPQSLKAPRKHLRTRKS